MANSENTKKLHQLFSGNQFDEVIEMVDENVEVVSHAAGMVFKGKSQFADFMKGFKNAFPDMVLRHTRLIENGNSVAVEFTAAGTHTGTLSSPAGDIPATGKKVKLNVCEVMEWQNGKLKSAHNYQDSMALMRQIGLA